jgi:signal transduction histidine kinase
MPDRREKLEAAHATRKSTVTPNVHGAAATPARNGTLFFTPIFDDDALVGYVTVLVDLEGLVARSLAEFFSTDDIAVTLVAETSPERGIYRRGEPAGPLDIPGMRHEERVTLVNVSGVRWRIEVLPSAAYWRRNRTVQPWSVLTASWLFSGLLAGFFLALTGRNEALRDLGKRLEIELDEKVRAHDSARNLELDLARLWRLNTVGEMAAGLAHELGQPIASMINYADAMTRVLQKRPGREPLLEDSLVEIRNEGQRAARFIQSLRAFITQREPSKAVEDLNSLVAEIVAFASHELRRSEARLTVRVTPAPLRVVVDRIQMGQVILNLIRNALESMAATAPAGRQLVVETRAAHGKACIDITDRGAGIPPENLKKVFEPFFTTKAGGMGMGLAISRNIVEAHGGRIWAARSDDGAGTTFHIELPGAAAEETP